MELLSRLLRFILQRVTVLRSAKKFHRNHGLAVAVVISSAEPSSPVAKKQKTSSPTSKSHNGKGVANKTVETKEVTEIPD